MCCTIRIASIMLSTLMLVAARPPPAADNIALHKSYTMVPAPNYPLTTDTGDAEQLTDGRKVSWGHLWTSREAVGWVNARPVVLTVDLGVEVPILGAAFSTAAGVAGVEWPRAIYLLSSEDGKRFVYLGNLIVLAARRGSQAPTDGYATFTFLTRDVSAVNARYVRFMIDGQGPFVFCDEIEVFASAVPGTQPAAGIEDTDGFFWRSRAADILQTMVANDRSRIEQRMGNRPADSTVKLVGGGADAGLSALPPTVSSDRPIELPLAGAHTDLYAALGAHEQATGAAPLAAWVTVPWDPLQMGSPAPPEPSRPLVMYLMTGEVRAAAVNLRNSTGRFVSADVSVTIDHETMPAYVRLSRVLWTPGDGGEPVAAILEAGASRTLPLTLTLPAGVTSQVWISFVPTNLAPGVHSGRLSIRANASDFRVPVELHVFRARMPASLPLLVGGWDYTDGDANGAAALAATAAIAAILREHGINTPWATAPTLEVGAADAGNRGAAVTTRLDTWIDTWHGARRFRVFLNVADSLGTARRGTPEFQQQIRRWAEFWGSVLGRHGIAPDKVDLLLIDEPRSSSRVDRTVDWADAIHRSGVGFRVLATVDYDDPSDVPDRFLNSLDTICLKLNRLKSSQTYETAIRAWSARYRAVEFYSTEGPSRSLDPYGYYRLQAWTAFATGAVGSSFWSLTDTGGALDSSEFTSNRPIYSPLAFSARHPLTTKQLEAIREGAEDYYYLETLRRLSEPNRYERASPAEVQQARNLLQRVARTVLGPPGSTDPLWRAPRDRSLADLERVSAGQLIDALASSPSN